MKIKQIPAYIKMCWHIANSSIMVQKADIASLRAYNYLMNTHIEVHENPDIYKEIIASKSGKSYEEYYKEALHYESWFEFFYKFIDAVKNQEKDVKGE